MLIDVIDSHTAGEPTRVVVGGWDIPAGADCVAMRDQIREFDGHIRTGVLLEPRGSDVVVGALLVPPKDSSCCTGVVFFNNTSVLGMCGHGAIGVIETLRYLNKIEPGLHRLETPVGIVEARLETDGTVWITNVPARVYQLDTTVETHHFGTITGDIVYGGNWFFLIQHSAFVPNVEFSNIAELTRFTMEVRGALEREGITGADGALIDHIEVFGPGTVDGAHSKNFVLCPGMAYDRSPCGTGTSAKMALMLQRGKLAVQKHWVQESITGTTFTGFMTIEDDQYIPHISGRAYVTAKATLIFQEEDPFRWGIV